MRFCINKSGQGHVEKILSMVLFGTFLIILFFFLMPAFRDKKEGDLNIKNIENKLIELMSNDVGKLSAIVAAPDENGAHCYSLNAVLGTYGNNFVEIKDPENDRRYTIYFGVDFHERRISCENNPGRDFTLGTYIKEKILTESKISILKNSYENNYKGIRNNLKIDDFVFEFRENGNIIEELSVSKNIPENVEIISITRLVRIINEEGQIRNFKLNIRSWR